MFLLIVIWWRIEKSIQTLHKCRSLVFHKQVNLTTKSLSFHHFKLLTCNLHHSRGTTTESTTAFIGWAGVGPSITRDQKCLASRITTITVIIATRHKATAACWSPAISYLATCSHNSASQGDTWCCSVVWRLVALLRWSVADVNHNLEGWSETSLYFSLILRPYKQAIKLIPSIPIHILLAPDNTPPSTPFYHPSSYIRCRYFV